MEKYNPINGVPKGSYYLTEITQFADFEISQEERILFTSKDKQELIDICRKNCWPCPDCGNDLLSWYTHYIQYRE